MSVRGVPVQELLENQAPESAVNVNEQTGEITPLEGAPKAKPEKKDEPVKAEHKHPARDWQDVKKTVATKKAPAPKEKDDDHDPRARK